MYPLLPALVKLLSMETKNAEAAAGLARQRRATLGQRNFGVGPIIAISPRAVGESDAGPCEPLLAVRNEPRSSSRLSRRSYPEKSKVKIRKKRFG